MNWALKYKFDKIRSIFLKIVSNFASALHLLRNFISNLDFRPVSKNPIFAFKFIASHASSTKMGLHSKKIFITCISLLIVLSVIIPYAYSTTPMPYDKLPDPIPQGSESKNQITSLHIKDRKTIFPNNNEMGQQYSKNQIYGKTMTTKKRKTRSKKLNSSPFMAMLPKGFVPPSGSSSCHNVYPNSITFFCDLSTERSQNPS